MKDVERGGYIEAIGRRKTAVARVRISKTGKMEQKVNGKNLEEYFPTTELRKTCLAPFHDHEEKFAMTVKVSGGGVSAQSEAIRHGATRALVEYKPEDRKKFKSAGFLTRDPRRKERKKPGLKKARRAPQWSKR